MYYDLANFDFPFRTTSFWHALAGESPETCRLDERGIPLNPLLAQSIPTPLEAIVTPEELDDPLGENTHVMSERVLQQYRSRVLVRATGRCFMHCRYCYRRSLPFSEKQFISKQLLPELTELLKKHEEVREVLISGGDPLTARDAQLSTLLHAVRAASPRILIRIATRAPLVLPQRITPALLELFSSARPLCVVLHINHPLELSSLFLEKAEMLEKCGIALYSQTVLLRGINDDPNTLITLFSRLNLCGIKPYYLFQGDLAKGTSHFRVPLSRGLDIYSTLRKELSGLELPRYAVDAPGGGGKIYLPEGIKERKASRWILKAPNGALYEYPEEA